MLRRNRPKRQPLTVGSSICEMCWLQELMDFWFPEPIETDIDGEPEMEDWRVELPDIPEHLRAEPAVAEAEWVLKQ